MDPLDSASADLNARILAACRLADAALPEWRRGWFAGLDVRRAAPNMWQPGQYVVPDLERLADAGLLTRGTFEQRVHLGTSAAIFRLVERA